ncbi:30S ribosomal protein S19 [Streptococcus iniae]|uniref:30S ribosomal protein S19 n=1 Tax=Streptococcus iniae TaxID=1346 RepID=A0ABM5QFR4_STRIN|nr:30S ribosomal protein S19 [Streptococcus iniae]AHY17075.1 30S ribosomal protein S19 [Streptococcus iniae]EKB53330.1 30S ribosomal protein S19 [Streptococcus iniae 9117]ESR09594.1 hypothetical protein IUSA1_06040 [Streptococcus iniae IUSA1]
MKKLKKLPFVGLKSTKRLHLPPIGSGKNHPVTIELHYRFIREL